MSATEKKSQEAPTSGNTTASQGAGKPEEGPAKEQPKFRDPAAVPLKKLSVNLIKTYKHINEVKPHLHLVC